MRIGDKVVAAALTDNATARAFEKLLPLSITMTELNRNEKFARLPGAVAARASTPPSIRTGDSMLYGSDTLVLFYKSFSTTQPPNVSAGQNVTRSELSSDLRLRAGLPARRRGPARSRLP
jgi:hypothetical protein